MLPELIAAAGDHASMRFVEFFTAIIRNAHTRRAYGRVGAFLAWCTEVGVPSLAQVAPTFPAVRSPIARRPVPTSSGPPLYWPPNAIGMAVMIMDRHRWQS